MKKRLPLILFLATVGTTFGTHLVFTTPFGLALDEARVFGTPILARGQPTVEELTNAALFSFCVILILGAHEMGHFLMARHHGVDSSPPYFIPIPLPLGTMGAVIRLRGQIPNRNALVDIGAAGPLAGLLVAIPLLVVGIMLCPVVEAPTGIPPMFLGDMSLGAGVPKLLAAFRGEDLGGASYYGHNLLSWCLQELIVGPLPPNKDLLMHPVYLAAWFGLVVTMLNLMPIGQLDGGHLTHAWFGDSAITVGKAMSVVLVGLIVFFSFTWILWFLLTMKLIGYRHPEVVTPGEPLSIGRKVVCAVCFAFFALTLMPVQVSM